MREEQLKLDLEDKYKCKYCGHGEFYIEEVMIYPIEVIDSHRLIVDGASGEPNSCVIKCDSCRREQSCDNIDLDWN